MRFKEKVDKQDGWRKRFAFFPMKIGDEWVWLEWYWQRFEGLFYNVAKLEDVPLCRTLLLFSFWVIYKNIFPILLHKFHIIITPRRNI